MTAQIGDEYTYKNEQYNIVAMSKRVGFNPKHYGLKLSPASTACWRGYWCEFEVYEGGIVLKNLYVHTADEKYPDIEGVSVKERDSNNLYEFLGHRLYADLNIAINYTGKILLGKEFVEGYYMHAGFQKAWAYKVLKEFVFENGCLIKTNDYSAIAEAIRNEAMQKSVERMDIQKIAEEKLALDYEINSFWFD